MRIAMFTTAKIYADQLTGGQKRFKELYTYLSKQYEVVLYSSDEHVVSDKVYRHIALKPVKQNKLAFTSTNVAFYKENKELIKSINDEEYDKIIVFDVTTAWLLWKAGIKRFELLLRQDIIEYKNISLIASGANFLKRAVYLCLMWISESRCIRSARTIVVQCNYDGNRLLNRHRLIRKSIANKLKVQINNVNPSWIIENANQVSNELEQRESGRFKIAYIGNVDDHRKGFDLLEQYLNNHITDKNVGAIVIGGGKKLTDYKKKYERNAGIIFTGHVNNPIKYLINCNLLVVPSRADSCPNTIIEALYSEVPVIGSNAGGIPELINDLQAVFELNAESLSDRIDELRKNRDLYLRIRANQLRRKEELTFDWAECIAEILEIM